MQTLSISNLEKPQVQFEVETRGNSSLSPEEITTYEMSYQNILKNRINTKFNLFFNKLDNLIHLETVETFPADFPFKGFPGGIIPSMISWYNSDKAEAIGGEAELAFYATKWLKGFANYSYQWLTDTQTHQKIKSVPAHKLNGGFNLQFEHGIKANIVAHYVSQTEWETVKIDAYTIVNARLAYSVMKDHSEISVSAFNLFNHKHRENPLGDEIGRRITTGLSYRF
jgi:outer membrane cobalamin receptor